jgi:hypothetical protein
MTDSNDFGELDEMGPVDYVVIEFNMEKMTGEAFPMLVELVDRGIIRILDFLVFTLGADGNVTVLEIADLDGDGTLDLAIFDGVRSGLIGDDDVEEAKTVIEPGSSAAILVYENKWAGPFASRLRKSGARMVASGRIPIQTLLAALEDDAAADAAKA